MLTDKPNCKMKLDLNMLVYFKMLILNTNIDAFFTTQKWKSSNQLFYWWFVVRGSWTKDTTNQTAWFMSILTVYCFFFFNESAWFLNKKSIKCTLERIQLIVEKAAFLPFFLLTSSVLYPNFFCETRKEVSEGCR